MPSEKVEPLTDAELMLVHQDVEHGGFRGDAEHTVLRLLATVQKRTGERDGARESLRLLREKVYGRKSIRDVLREDPTDD